MRETKGASLPRSPSRRMTGRSTKACARDRPPAVTPHAGGARGARTPDLLHAMQALFQLSYGPASWYRAHAGRRDQRRCPGLQSVNELDCGSEPWYRTMTAPRQCRDLIAATAPDPCTPGGFMPDAAALDRDPAAGANSPIVQAAERLVTRIEALVNQVAELKADNAALRREVREALALIDRAGDAAAPPRAVRRSAAPAARHAKSRRRGKRTKGKGDTRVGDAGHRPGNHRQARVRVGVGDREGAERSRRPGVRPRRPLARRARGCRDRRRGRRTAPVPAADSRLVLTDRHPGPPFRAGRARLDRLAAPDALQLHFRECWRMRIDQRD